MRNPLYMLPTPLSLPSETNLHANYRLAVAACLPH